MKADLTAKKRRRSPEAGEPEVRAAFRHAEALWDRLGCAADTAGTEAFELCRLLEPEDRGRICTWSRLGQEASVEIRMRDAEGVYQRFSILNGAGSETLHYILPGEPVREAELRLYPLIDEDGKTLALVEVERWSSLAQSGQKPASQLVFQKPLLGQGLSRIQRAIDAGEFELHYQPRVNMCSGKVVGAEAFLFWNHPDKGILEPNQFLEALEGQALEIGLGDWVIESALRQMDRWLDQAFEIAVSVKAPSGYLRLGGFVERMAEIVHRYPRIQPSNLGIDIQASSAPNDVEHIRRLIKDIHELGVVVALDDFGGNSVALSELKNLPTKTVKIGPSFIRDVANQAEDLSILEGMLGLAQAFQRKSVAGGVDTADQSMILLQLGCEEIQGFAIAAPMPAEQFPAWVHAWKPDPRWKEVLAAPIDERVLMYAGAEHRGWITGIGEYLIGNSQKAPQLNRHQCQMGIWLDQQAQGTRSSQPEFQAIAASHLRLHAFGANAVKQQPEGGGSNVAEKVDKLAALLEMLLEMLRNLR
jgi:EAL domain-containing protein (putative c-di-GMP-specific phosphodiesterase class I)